MKKYRKNDIVTVKIDDLTDLGFGVGRISGAVIFISDTVPGDIVEAKIIKVNSSYLVGKAEKFIERSPMLCSTRCSEGKCHSCAYKNISYSDESRLKEEGVRRLFSRLGIETAPILPSPSETRYRNKAQYPIALVGGEYQVGFYMPKSHRVTPIDDCPLAPAVFGEIINSLREYFAKNSLTVYDEESGRGLLRHIYLRRGEMTGEILVTLVVTDFNLPDTDGLVSMICERFPAVVGVLLNRNAENTNVVLGDEYKLLFGRDYIYDILAGVRLKISAPSFYQVNHDAAEKLYALAKSLAKPTKKDTLVDLYCGAGSIGLSMAKEAGEVIGIEIVDSAVECARENARENGIDNAYFFTGDAKDTERLLEAAERELGRKIDADIVILDPPRAGCDEKLIDYVARLSPERIVYISCNPKTLARDVERFMALGYGTKTVTPVDLFAGTGHVESVVCLTRSDKAT